MKEVLKDGIEPLLAAYERSFQIERWLHPSRLPEEISWELYQLLRSVSRTKDAIELWLWETLSLKDEGIPEVLKTRWKIVFLDTKTLQKLELYLGASCEFEAISHMIVGTSVTALKEKLGETLYRFVMRQVPILLKTITPVFPNTIESKTNLLERIDAKGRWILESLLSDAPSALLRRFVLQFPKNIVWNFSHKTPEEVLTPYETMTKCILNTMSLDLEHLDEKKEVVLC